MSQPATPSPNPAYDVGHTHPDVSGGWLRAATFGAMDGLVSNSALIAGVAAADSVRAVMVSGIAEVHVERRALRTRPQAERAELASMLVEMGMTEKTAQTATDEIHRDENRAVGFHLVQEIGLDPTQQPSARLAAAASFVMFAIGAVIPLIPYLLGYGSLAIGLGCGAVGLLIAGGLTARYTRKPVWWAAGRQLMFGAVAVAATYLLGLLVASLM
jgi:VIT1/CCC1 family predicted Fe2+/Mn2+ transporter